VGLVVSTVNVNGVRAAARKALLEWLGGCGADVVCLQETRAKPDELSAVLPRDAERAWLDRLFGEAGYVDVVRSLHPDAEHGPYSWWSFRGRAFDNDAGWRIDYHAATPGLAARARSAVVDRAPTWDTRWSDHAPVTVLYDR